MLSFEIVLGIVLIVDIFADRKVLKTVDCCLLLAFISFFIFTGNLGNIPVNRDILQKLVNEREFSCQALPQIIELSLQEIILCRSYG